MKQLVAIALLVTFISSLSIPAAAQKKFSSNPGSIKGNFAEFERAEAVTTGFGAFIRWQMKEETHNAGFFVYRQGPNGFERVGDLVLGSAATAGRAALYGGTYDTYDPAGSLGSVYVIRSLAMDGRQLSSDPVSAVYTSDPAAITGRPTDTFDPNARKRTGQIARRTLDLPLDLADEVRAALDAPDLTTHRWVVSQPGAKIGVRQEGFYRVTSAQLQAVGFNVASDSTKWRLFAEGVEQSIIVGAGDQYIEFYGKGIDTVESDTHIYYLLADTTAGKRITNKVIRNIGGTVISRNYKNVSEKKERTNYVNSFLNGDAENFWGRVVTSTPTTVNFTLTGIDAAGGPASFLLKMQGFSATVLDVSPVLNGHQLPPASGNGPLPFSLSGEIPSNFLVEGNNTLQLTMAASNQFSLFDSISINYDRKYQADQNKVSFYTPGYRKVDLGNFSSANVRVFDITHDGDPVLATNVPVVQEGGTFTAKLPAYRAMVMYGIEDSGLLPSPAITANVGSTLSTPGNAANMVIISYSSPDFMAAAETWANYRRSMAGGGFTVKVIDVADIFDEYSYGSLNAASINAFLNYAKNNWLTQPQYVMLLGDASYDPRNYGGLGYFDMVPTKMVNLVYAESGSDEALADFDNDGLAEIAIGRIAARTAPIVTTVFNKTTTFETSLTTPWYSRGAVYAHDLPIGYDFQGMSQILRDELPPAMTSVMVDKAAANSTATVISEINNGRYIVNYAGHGSTGAWANTFFSITHVPQLTNASNPTVFTMLTCLNGYFIRVDFDSLAEALVNAPNGGAVAAWASTEKTTPDIQLIMGQRFYNQLNAGNIPRIGDLIRDAKAAVPGGSDVRLSWVLLGDPALKIR